MIAVISNTLKYVRREGPFATLQRIVREIPYRFYRHTKDRQWAGRLVELLGNRWRLDGCTFFLNHPSIQTKLKSRFLNRSYETQERRLVKRHLERDLPTIELGASLGVVSCLTNRLMAHPEKHVVVEANPDLIPLLERHRRVNSCRFEIVHAAYAHGGSEVIFYLHERFVGGSATRKTDRQVRVQAVTLQSLLDQHRFERINLVVDVEGEEIPLIEREGALLQQRVAVLIIEMHPGMIVEPTVADRAHEQLRSLGFQLLEKDAEVYAYRNQSMHVS